MANTQINISANGTKTLATAGKYCDRNIDVNVNVPVPNGYIKPSGSKTITENGTHDVTSYASAVVDVPTAQPTQFTNLYDPANVVLKSRGSYSSSSGLSITSDTYCNYIKIPYHHKAGESVDIRVRGLSFPIRDRHQYITFASNGTTGVVWGNLNVNVSYDEYGDMVCSFKAGSSDVTKEWYYLLLNIQYTGVNNNAAQAFTGPIITINEPIGNGGHV